MVQGIGENIEKAIKFLLGVAVVGLISLVGWIAYFVYLAFH